MRAVYLTHPEVDIDPTLPPPQWRLNATGRARATAFAERRLFPTGTPIIASPEPKALETAQIIAAPSGANIEAGAAFRESDRPGIGFLLPAEFEARLAALYAVPDASAVGWETAIAAQNRIVAAVTAAAAARAGEPTLVFVGHGTVGTLLKCHFGRRPIARAEDQRRMAAPGGGNCFAFDLQTDRLLSDWQSFEDFGGLPD
jgi:broad specificity phosphatase PhoE